jgi:hypothetical protein
MAKGVAALFHNCRSPLFFTGRPAPLTCLFNHIYFLTAAQNRQVYFFLVIINTSMKNKLLFMENFENVYWR